MNNCRTCSKYCEIQECVSIGFRITENACVLNLLKEWALIKVFNDDKLPQVICKVCFISVKSFTNFIDLIRKSDQEFKEVLYKVDYCRDENNLGTTTNTLESKLTHAKENKFDKSTKEICESSISLREQEKKIEKSNIVVHAENTTSFECLTCHKTFKKSYQYKTHMSIHTGERKYSCTICGKSFAKSYVLVYHMRVHTGEKKFSCNFCTKSFIHPSNLYKHKKIHTNTRNYKCESCSKSFIQSEALKIHVRRIHTGEKPFLCEMCSKSFSCQSALWLHKQDTHMQKETCPHCNKQFSSRNLKQHIARHKNKELEIKKCICEQCGKNLSSDHNLKQHLSIHDGIKPYASQPMPCPLCKKLYSKRRIKSHICMSSNDY